MSVASEERLERYLIKVLRRFSREANDVGFTGVATGDVVSDVGSELNVPAVKVREAIWRLVDAQQIEFTDGRRLRVGSGGAAA